MICIDLVTPFKTEVYPKNIKGLLFYSVTTNDINVFIHSEEHEVNLHLKPAPEKITIKNFAHSLPPFEKNIRPLSNPFPLVGQGNLVKIAFRFCVLSKAKVWGRKGYNLNACCDFNQYFSKCFKYF